MKLTINQLSALARVVTDLNAARCPIKTAYKLSKVYAVCQEQLSIIAKTRHQIIEGFGIQRGQEVPAEKAKEIDAKIAELGTMEVEVVLPTFKLDEFGESMEATPGIMSVLDFVIAGE